MQHLRSTDDIPPRRPRRLGVISASFRPRRRPHRTSPWMPNWSAGRCPDVARVRRRCFAARRFRPTPPKLSALLSSSGTSVRVPRFGQRFLEAAAGFWPGPTRRYSMGSRVFWDETSQHETNQKGQPAAAMQQQKFQQAEVFCPALCYHSRILRTCKIPAWSGLKRHRMTRGQPLHQGNLGRRPVTPAPGRVAEEGPESGVAGLV